MTKRPAGHQLSLRDWIGPEGQISVDALLPPEEEDPRDSRLRACSLVSGSSGNAYVFSYGKDALLIDAGLSLKRFLAFWEDACFSSLRLRGVLVTHEHSDHVTSVSRIASYFGVPLYGSAGTLSWIRQRYKRAAELDTVALEKNDELPIGPFFVRALPLSHDAVEPLGYRVEAGERSYAIVTDTGELTPGLLKAVGRCDLVFLEANYEEDLLLSGPYPYHLKQRIASRHGHLSNRQAAEALVQLRERGCHCFVLSHLSETNNHPFLAEQSLVNRLAECGLEQGRDYGLAIAPRYAPSAWLEPGAEVFLRSPRRLEGRELLRDWSPLPTDGGLAVGDGFEGSVAR